MTIVEDRKDYLRPKDVARKNSISLSQVYRAISSGDLRSYRFMEKTVLIRPEDAQEWIDRNRTPLRAEA